MKVVGIIAEFNPMHTGHKYLVEEAKKVTNSDVAICIMSGDFKGAYSQLAQLIEQNEKPEIILSTLGSVYIDMYRMRVANESGMTISNVSADFKYGRRDFVLKKANSNSKKYSTSALRKALDIILQTDIKLKSTRADTKILLETLITRLMLALREDL